MAHMFKAGNSNKILLVYTELSTLYLNKRSKIILIFESIDTPYQALVATGFMCPIRYRTYKR